MPNHERLVNDFSDLVRIDSPSGEEWDVALHVSERLSNLGFQVARDDHGKRHRPRGRGAATPP